MGAATDGLDPIRRRLPRWWLAREWGNRGSGNWAVSVQAVPCPVVLALVVRHPDVLSTGGVGQPDPQTVVEALRRLPHARVYAEVTLKPVGGRWQLRLEIEDIELGAPAPPAAVALLVPSDERCYLDEQPDGVTCIGYVTGVPDPAPFGPAGRARMRLLAGRALVTVMARRITS